MPSLDGATRVLWTFGNNTEIRINWGTLLNTELVSRSTQTMIESTATMDRLSRLAMHSSLLAGLVDGQHIWLSDNPAMWGAAVVHRPTKLFGSRDWPKAIQTDCRESILQYVLYATAEDAFQLAVRYTGKTGDQSHCQLLTRAARALRLAELIRPAPTNDMAPEIALNGTPQAIGILLDLFLYKTKTKPPATVVAAKYAELSSVLRSIIENAKAIADNQSAPEKGRQWAKTVIAYAAQQRAINTAHELLGTADDFAKSCAETASAYATAIKLLEWAKATEMPAHKIATNKLSFAYKMDLSTEERRPNYIPPVLTSIQANDTSTLPLPKSLLAVPIHSTVDAKYKTGLSECLAFVYGPAFFRLAVNPH